MATLKIPQHDTYIYSEVNIGKYRSVKHYEYVPKDRIQNKLSILLNISDNRLCALSMPEYWLKIREGKKWSGCITGLFKTEHHSIFKGDRDKKKHLILFKFLDDFQTLEIKYFQNYYTRDLRSLLPLFKD